MSGSRQDVNMLFTERKRKVNTDIFEMKTQSICNIKKCEFYKEESWAPERQWEENLSMLIVMWAFLQVVLFFYHF